MDRKERALELARQQYADGGGPRYTPSYTEHGALIEPSMRDRANMVRDAFDSVAEHPFVRVAREYPREMAQEIGSSMVGGIKAAPGAAKNLAVNTARYVYNNPSKAAGNALEFAVGMSPNPTIQALFGPLGIFSPSSAKAPELDPEIAMRHAQAQEARLMQDENYAGGYAEGGEVREAHSNGKKVVGPLAAAAESAMTRAAEKILADKAAERAARYVADPEQRAANLAKWQAQTQAEIAEPTWYHGTFTDVDSLRPGRADATFVSRDPNFANRFATPADKGPSADWDAVNKVWVSRESLPSAPNVMPMHVRAENPFDYDNKDHIAALKKQFQPDPNDPNAQYYVGQSSMGDWSAIENPAIQKAIRDLGHDSFYVMEDGTKNLGLYDPTRQLKSATGNLGTFDPNIPRLTEAKGGTVVKRAIMLASKMA